MQADVEGCISAVAVADVMVATKTFSMSML
jgi:hypothetical protein